jgi:transposase
MAIGSEILLTKQQHSDLSSIAQSRALPAGYVFRAKLILMLAEGSSFNAIKRQLQTTAPTIVRWKQRFRQHGLEGLDTYHPGQKPSVLTPALRARILSVTRRKPSDGSTHWSCRKLASVLGVSKDAVHRVWQEAGLKPHRLERYMASDDPEFESKAADILGLYLRPPQHAAVFCVDEKTAIQALDRLDPVLPLSPGRAEPPRLRVLPARDALLNMRRSIPPPVASTAKPLLAIPAVSSSPFCKRSYPCARLGNRFTSSSTISPRTKLKQSASSSNNIRESGFTSRPLTRPGSTRSRSGLPRSNGRLSPAVSLPRFPI